MTPRREFSTAVRKAAWERADGRCEGFVAITEEETTRRWPLPYNAPVGSLRRCNAPIDLGGFHYDHIDPDYFGANDRANLSNVQVLCTQCHKDKTKKDIKDIAKSKRIVAKRIKAKKPRGRPIMGSKRSGWRIRMSGRVERR